MNCHFPGAKPARLANKFAVGAASSVPIRASLRHWQRLTTDSDQGFDFFELRCMSP